MRDPPSYEQLNTNFDWTTAERELGYRPGDVINIGWMMLGLHRTRDRSARRQPGCYRGIRLCFPAGSQA
jgi:hypothetical protein